jgi:hypothetical protein
LTGVQNSFKFHGISLKQRRTEENWAFCRCVNQLVGRPGSLKMSCQKYSLFYFLCSILDLWAGLRSRYSDWLRAGRSGERNLVGAKFSTPVQAGPGAHPVSCTMSTGSLSPGVNDVVSGVVYPPPFSAKVKEWSSTSTPPGTSWPVLGSILPFLLYRTTFPLTPF